MDGLRADCRIAREGAAGLRDHATLTLAAPGRQRAPQHTAAYAFPAAAYPITRVPRRARAGAPTHTAACMFDTSVRSLFALFHARRLCRVRVRPGYSRGQELAVHKSAPLVSHGGMSSASAFSRTLLRLCRAALFFCTPCALFAHGAPVPAAPSDAPTAGCTLRAAGPAFHECFVRRGAHGTRARAGSGLKILL